MNVLIAASRSDHPHHKTAFVVLDRALAACANSACLKLMPMVAASFLRLVTSPTIFVQPTPVVDAVGFVDAPVAVPSVEVPSLSAEWAILRQLCMKKMLTANDMLAAAVFQLGEHK